MTNNTQLEADFETLFNSIHGYLSKEARASWTKNMWEEASEYNKAYTDFWTARTHLCERFGIEWDDPDLELFMNGITEMDEDLCRRMFLATVEYAKRGFKIETASEK